MKVSASHHSTVSSSSLDSYDFEDASAVTQGIVEACKRRNFRHRARAKRSQRNQQRVISTNSTETYQFADARNQDPAVFANFLADHFVARQASNVAVASPPVSANSQQLLRPVAGSVGLGSFRSWQFGERCLATYRVLFGRPLWAATSSVPPASPRPRKRKHGMPTSSEMNELEVEAGSGEMLVLPTVDELLELPADDTFELDGGAEEDVLAGLAIDLSGLGTESADGMDLLWDLDASDVGGAMLTEGEEAELRFLTGEEDMEDI